MCIMQSPEHLMPALIFCFGIVTNFEETNCLRYSEEQKKWCASQQSCHAMISMPFTKAKASWLIGKLIFASVADHGFDYQLLQSDHPTFNKYGHIFFQWLVVIGNIALYHIIMKHRIAIIEGHAVETK
jgi:hypothetical protein